MTAPDALFEQVYRQYARKLYQLCLVQLRNSHDAEDVVQDVFVKRLYCAPGFQSPEHERRWMYQVAVRLCRDRLKRKSRSDLPIERAEHLLLDAEEQSLLDSVAALPEKNRVVIHLYYYEGYSVKEIAGILGVTVSSVKMRLKRGREALHTQLEAEV